MTLTEGTSVGPYKVGPVIMDDDFCSLHQGASSDAEVWLKHYKDAMSGLNEAVVLKSLHGEPDPRFIPYLPSAPMVTPESVSVFAPLDGCYSLAQVKERHGELDARDMAWMYRRLLVALGFAHQTGYVHAAVLPQNVWIHPEKHGLILTGWAHALPATGLPSPEVLRYPGSGAWYPPEDEVTPALDLFMAASLATWLCGGSFADPTAHYPRIPKEMRTVLLGSLKANPEHRIGFNSPAVAAWTALEYFDACITRLWGKRTFRPFSMEDA